MNFKAPFVCEVRIRLTDDLNGFVCTVQPGWFRRKSQEVVADPLAQSLKPIDGHAVPEPILARYRRRPLP